MGQSGVCSLTLCSLCFVVWSVLCVIAFPTLCSVASSVLCFVASSGLCSVLCRFCVSLPHLVCILGQVVQRLIKLTRISKKFDLSFVTFR